MYTVSNKFRQQEYSGEALFNAKLYINDILVPNDLIASINLSEPIIDTSVDYFYLGSFISNKLTIKFKNMNELDEEIVSNIKSGQEVYLEITQNLPQENLLDDSSFKNINVPSNSGFIIQGLNYTISAGTYRFGLFVNNELVSTNNVYAISFRNGSNIVVEKAHPNEDFTITNEQASLINNIQIYVNNTFVSTYSGQTITGAMITTAPISNYKEYNPTSETVPIGYFLIDNLSEDYFSKCEITCMDYAIKLKTPIDYSPCFEPSPIVSTDKILNNDTYAGQYSKSCKLTDNKIFIAHSGSNNRLNFCIATINGNNINVSDDVTLTGSGTTWLYECLDVARLTNTKVFVACGEADGVLKGIICTIDGDNITLGNLTTLSNNDYSAGSTNFNPSIAVLSEDKVFILHRSGGNNSSTNKYLNGMICLISDTNITVQKDENIKTYELAYKYASAIRLKNTTGNEVFIIYNKGDYLFASTYLIAENDYSFVLMNDLQLSSTQDSYEYAKSVLIDTNKVFVAYNDGGKVGSVVCTINNNYEITTGANKRLTNQNSTYYDLSVTNFNTNKVFIAYSSDYSNKYSRGMECYINGTNVTVENSVELSNNKNSCIRQQVVNVEDGKVIIIHNNGSTSSQPAIQYLNAVMYYLGNPKASTNTILNYICNQSGITIDTDLSTLPNPNIEVGTYDSTVSGKQWISYIAETKGCNVKIARNGHLILIPFKKTTPDVTINALESAKFELGEKYEISRVIFTDALRNYTYGTNTYNTLYIRQDNPFIADTNVVQNIYNAVNGMVVYSLKTENYGDISLDCWDLIQYTLGTDENDNVIAYNTYNNCDLTYEMNISSKVETKIPTKQQEITTNVLGDDKARIRKISTDLDYVNGEISMIAQDIDELDDTTADLTTKYSQTAHSISLTATDNQTTAGLTIKLKNADGTEIDSKSANIEMSGKVSFTDLSTSNPSTTIINGDNITTGLIKSSNYVANTSGTSLNLTNGVIDTKNFKVDNQGNMTCTNANVSGQVTATSGNIAGWTIDSQKGLYNGTGNSQAGIGINGISWAFWAGSEDSATAPFHVGHSGGVYASSGVIAGWTLNNDGLSNANGFYINNYSLSFQGSTYNVGVSNIYTMSDIIVCRAILLGSLPMPDVNTPEFNHYDINKDGVIDASDLLAIRFILNQR